MSRVLRPRNARSRSGLLLIVVPLLSAAVATAATVIVRSGPPPGEQLLKEVLSITHSGRSAGPCAVAGGPKRPQRLTREAPDSRITKVLPQLASPPKHRPSARTIAMVEHGSGGPVLARTIREVKLPNGIKLIVWVSHGSEGFSTVEPKRCLAARLAALATLRPNPHDLLRNRVAHRLKTMSDIQPAPQSLSLQVGSKGGGVSLPLNEHGKPLPTGVMFNGDSCSPRHGHTICAPLIYVGIARPDVAYVTIAPARPRERRGVRRRIAVRQGVFAFRLSKSAGAEVIVQRSRYGRVLVSKPLFDHVLELARMRALSERIQRRAPEAPKPPQAAHRSASAPRGRR